MPSWPDNKKKRSNLTKSNQLSKKKVTFTFGVTVCEQLDVKLFSEGCEVRRHHTAGGQVDLVTAGLHLVQERERHQ